MPGTSARHRRDVLNLAAQVKKKRDVLIELNQQTESLTKRTSPRGGRHGRRRSITSSRTAAPCSTCTTTRWSICTSPAVSPSARERPCKTVRPHREERQGGRQSPPYVEREWFNDFLDLALDSPYFGHSLIQFGDITNENGVMSFTGVELVPRKHVVPEYGVITREAGDDWKNGISYREGDIAVWCIEVGKARDLGVLLKCAPQSLSKKNMLAYWDTFGEVFGMPIRIGKTMSQDTKDIARIETMLAEMGAASWGLFPEGTEIEIKETSRGDAYNVYDKRIDRCNSEISKGILGQTMTIDNGSSLSQSETHLEVFENICRADATMIKYLVNDRLIPLMIRHGFPLAGVTFDWNEATSYTPAEQREIERLLLQEYDIDPNYFADKYKIPITGVKKTSANSFSSRG